MLGSICMPRFFKLSEDCIASDFNLNLYLAKLSAGWTYRIPVSLLGFFYLHNLELDLTTNRIL